MVAALQALLVLCHFQFLLTLVRGGHHPHGFNRTVLAELEHLGELYYDEQKDERVYNEAQDFAKVKPNFPCVHGVTPLGSADRSSVVDGHKFACGLHAVSKSPIVYSFGSNQQQDFEMAVLRYRPDARIFVFELIESHLPDKAVQDSRIEYNVLGLGGYPDSEASEYVMKTMEAIMKERKHTYVDIVKMDIEGVEFDFLHTEGQKIVPRIGQLLVELHLHFGYVNMDMLRLQLWL